MALARSSTTRRGNGGWGGAAKGAGNKGAGPGRGNTHRTVAELMAAQGAREKAADAWMAILNDPAHPRHADMVAKAAERMDGAPVQRLSVAGVNPDDMTDAELAAIAAGRGGAPHSAEGDQD